MKAVWTSAAVLHGGKSLQSLVRWVYQRAESSTSGAYYNNPHLKKSQNKTMKKNAKSNTQTPQNHREIKIPAFLPQKSTKASCHWRQWSLWVKDRFCPFFLSSFLNKPQMNTTKAAQTYCPCSPNQFMLLSPHETASFIQRASDGHQKDEVKQIPHFLHDLYLLKMTAMGREAARCSRRLQKARQGWSRYPLLNFKNTQQISRKRQNGLTRKTANTSGIL